MCLLLSSQYTSTLKIWEHMQSVVATNRFPLLDNYCRLIKIKAVANKISSRTSVVLLVAHWENCIFNNRSVIAEIKLSYIYVEFSATVRSTGRFQQYQQTLFLTKKKKIFIVFFFFSVPRDEIPDLVPTRLVLPSHLWSLRCTFQSQPWILNFQNLRQVPSGFNHLCEII